MVSSMFRRAARPFLPDRHYLPIAMPTRDVQVFDVLTRARDGSLDRYSRLDEVLVISSGDVHVYRDQPVVDTSGSSGSTAKLGLGLNVVSSLIQALGGDAGIDVQSSNATGVRYSYAKVVSDRVDLASLDGRLYDADLRPDLHNAADLLAAGQIYVVVGVLRARALEVEFVRDGTKGVDVDVPAIQALVGADITVGVESHRSSRMTFTGKTTLTVAAKAARLNLAPDRIWINERLHAAGEVRGLGDDYAFLDGDELRLA
jgi:hypothetical protein